MNTENQQPWFQDANRARSLLAELESWRGTPFAGHCAVKGAGVDCVRFGAAVMGGAGVMAPVAWPSYPLNGGDTRHLEKICAVIEAGGNFTAVPADGELLPGDLLVFSSNRFHHVGVSGVWPEFYHVIRGYGVVTGDLRDATFGGRLYRVYRCMEEAP